MSNDTEQATDAEPTWAQGEAADQLADALDQLRETRRQMDSYQYSYPEYLRDDRERSRRRVRDAVRALLA